MAPTVRNEKLFAFDKPHDFPTEMNCWVKRRPIGDVPQAGWLRHLVELNIKRADEGVSLALDEGKRCVVGSRIVIWLVAIV